MSTSLRAHKAGEVLAALGDYQVTTGAELAATVKVSERTIYRYIRQLRAAGAPILSEAGMGYQLKRERSKREVAQP
ncbi:MULTISPECIES: helix-turn-helix domain-containing protein [unclassified Mesorhizobium]|uniref:helix-turn-helix domain-containing protein n=1 Tax=unclassified Mesorhizobium TaxID=325217 RepID=UPI000FCBCC17|nr:MULTISPECIES: helix-turn-helix domain-containing protein [unclassified Mesorhizobium]TGP22349.1 helix-turn-helix domain-containing protein [Mesorhizobium sp. M1D.F.Ca.ET.231.01.1.1]TGP24681.1 helix-turn-helix domain-containing protein [Mesorhizobium sp. M1D.F.Ca.ET.234.01.1.1]TGS37284.1 helix-turn-helix domain-containing protein [Mesorhizobium sp. M1D.F.Ca.ET.184.01.1.1]TGS58084.1 helix-turn-helix domain-containing protein [Mesorhizobium sp. M1D.F.Ca.ET.183.01.1.1]TGU59066.1 helix-turn-heli